MVYGTQFTAISPRIATSVLTNRLKKGRAVDDEMMEFFKERAQIEENYGKSLQKLSKRLQTNDREREKERELLGTCRKLWNQITSTTSDLSKCHLLVAERFLKDFENAVKARDKANDGDWQELKKFEQSLMKLARDFEENQAKLTKKREVEFKGADTLTEKQEKKMAEAKQKYEESVNNWKNEAASIFDKFETMDRRQLEFIQNVMKKTVEFQLDNLRLQVMNFEQILKSVMEMDLDSEINNFANNYAKEESSPHVPESPTDANHEQKANTTDKNSKEDFVVDAEGYRIPQMDPGKWKNEIAGNIDDDGSMNGSKNDISMPAKFKIDIKSPGEVSVDSKDLEIAAAAFKDTIGIAMKPSSSKTRIRRGQSTATTGPDSPVTSNMIINERLPDQPVFLSPKTREDELIDLFGSTGGSQLLMTPSLIPSSNSSTIKPDDVSIISKQKTSGNSQNLPSEDLFMLIRSIPEETPKLSDLPKWIEQVGLKLKFQETLQVTEKSIAISGNVIISINNTPNNHYQTLTLKLDSKYEYKALIGFQQLVDEANKSHSIEIDMKRLSETKELAVCKYQMETNNISILPAHIAAKIKANPSQTQLAIMYETKKQIQDFSVLSNTDGDISSPITKPTAAWNPEKKKLLWKIGNVNAGQSGKLFAQWEVSQRRFTDIPVAVKYLVNETRLDEKQECIVAGNERSKISTEMISVISQLVSPQVINTE